MTDKVDPQPEDAKEEEVKVNDNLKEENNEQKINTDNLFTPTEEKLVVLTDEKDENKNVGNEKENEPKNVQQEILTTECPLNEEDITTMSYSNNIFKNRLKNSNVSCRYSDSKLKVSDISNNSQTSTNGKVGFYQKTKNWVKQKWKNLYFGKGQEMEESLDAHGNKILLPKLRRRVYNGYKKPGNNSAFKSYDPKNSNKNINYDTYVSLPDVFSGYLF